jgi:hypothetical protein
LKGHLRQLPPDSKSSIHQRTQRIPCNPEPSAFTSCASVMWLLKATKLLLIDDFSQPAVTSSRDSDSADPAHSVTKPKMDSQASAPRFTCCATAVPVAPTMAAGRRERARISETEGTRGEELAVWQLHGEANSSLLCIWSAESIRVKSTSNIASSDDPRYLQQSQ